MTVSWDVQQIVFFAFAITWGGTAIALYVRTYAKQRMYLRQFAHEFPFLGGEPLFDMPRTVHAYQVVSRLMHEWQADPELERLRREMWRRNTQMIVWIFAAPVASFGVMALLIGTGQAHLCGRNSC